MNDIITLDPDLKDSGCWHFTCDKKAVTHDIIVIHNDDRPVMFYAPVCMYHKANPCRGKVGMFSSGEIRVLRKLERLIRFLGRHIGE